MTMVGLRGVVTGSPGSDYKEMEASEVSFIGSKAAMGEAQYPKLINYGDHGNKTVR